MAWDSDAADAATGKAMAEAQTMLAAMTEEERNGVRKLAGWWKKWYNGNGTNHATGHKALARWLVTSVNNPK
jgi:hypothetical protein